MRRNKFVLFGVFLIVSSFLFLPSVFSADETITISTYYPAPYGIYKELRAQRVAIGENYINNAQYCWAPNVCTNQINTNADLVVEGKVGIGTHTLEGTAANPYPLTVLNRMAIRNEEPTTGDYLLWLNDTHSNSGFAIGIDDQYPAYMRLRPAFNSGILITGQNDNIGVSVTSGDPVGSPSSPLKYVNVGIAGVANPVLIKDKLQVFGNIKATGGVTIGDDTDICDASKAGTLRYRSAKVEYCRNNAWSSIGGGTKVYYASDAQASLRDFTQNVRNTGSYVDNYLVLRVPVKAGDIVKVTVGGAIRGSVYTIFAERTGNAVLYSDGVNSATWPATTAVINSDWASLHLMCVYKATADATLVFQEGFNQLDLNGDTMVAARSAVAEVISP